MRIFVSATLVMYGFSDVQIQQYSAQLNLKKKLQRRDREILEKRSVRL